MSTTSATAETTLQTPALDSNLPKLLQQITEEGGYAFASAATLSAAGDKQAAEAAMEMAWEQIQSAPSDTLVPIWRDAYAMACLLVAKQHYSCGELKLAIRALDLGVIMGGLALKDDLKFCIGKVSDALRRMEFCENGDGREKGECSTDFSLAEVPKLLPVGSLSGKRVEKKSGLSVEGFLQEHLISGSPVIISDSMSHWPAMDRWNDMNYLKRVAGFRTVRVKVGKNHPCPEWKPELITFSEFLDRIQSNDSSSTDTTYLAHHQLFDQIQELKQDIVVPEHCFAGGGEIKSLDAWFGPPGTAMPLHYDPHHIILAQVVGKKYVRLYPHSESMLTNSSQVVLDNIDDGELTKVLDLEFVDCIMEEGEMLYIPPKWWHYVRSLTTGFSVSFCWNDDKVNPQDS